MRAPKFFFKVGQSRKETMRTGFRGTGLRCISSQEKAGSVPAAALSPHPAKSSADA